MLGHEVSHYENNFDFDCPFDAQRISCIKMLIENGFENRIVTAHDVHRRHRLIRSDSCIFILVFVTFRKILSLYLVSGESLQKDLYKPTGNFFSQETVPIGKEGCLNIYNHISLPLNTS